MYVCMNDSPSASVNFVHLTQCKKFAWNVKYRPWRPTQDLGMDNMDCTEMAGT